MSLQSFIHDYWFSWFINPIRRWCYGEKPVQLEEVVVIPVTVPGPRVTELRRRRLNALNKALEESKNAPTKEVEPSREEIMEGVRERIRKRKLERMEVNPVKPAKQQKPGYGGSIIHVTRKVAIGFDSPTHSDEEIAESDSEECDIEPLI